MISVFTSLIDTATNVGIATNVDGYGYGKVQITMQRGDNINGLVSINAVFFIEEADFSTGAYFTLGTIEESYCRPNGYITVAGSEILLASNYKDGTGTSFAGTQVLDTVSFLIEPNGTISAYVAAVTTPATLTAVDHVLLALNVTFSNLIEESIVVLP
jgi:hypothetical protein